MKTNLLRKALPWGIGVYGAVYFLFVIFRAAVPSATPANKFNLDAFAVLPVVDRGRVQPMDTVARVNLLIINSRQDFVEEKDGPKRPALEWLLDTMISGFKDDAKRAERAEKYPIFRIENDQLLSALKLDWRTKFLRYSLEEFKDKRTWLFQEAARIDDYVPVKERTAYDAKLIELARHVQLYEKLALLRAPLSVPPTEGFDEWLAIPEAYEFKHPLTYHWQQILKAYLDNDPRTFNESVAEYQKVLDKDFPADAEAGQFETFFNRFEPFNKCIHMYITVFALAVLSWMRFGWSKELNQAAFVLAAITLVVHTSALIMRMMIQGRPPVTNLYSSAVFIGWGCVILGLFLDWIYKNGIGNAVAAVTGGSTLVIAHHLAQSGDTLEMMQAVLDTNFWLATHVVIINFGYTATFVAGFIGIGYILLGVCTPYLDSELKQSLTKMCYGVLCFATLLSFVGTVLGGIWADQSWGRFWGWDPKENGALMIVLWNALILHARWGGMVKQRGMAVLAIGGNIITAWSWFGTNLLGVGLHAYGGGGEMNRGVLWMMIFVGSQLAIMALALIPQELWWSNRQAALPSFKPTRA